MYFFYGTYKMESEMVAFKEAGTSHRTWQAQTTDINAYPPAVIQPLVSRQPVVIKGKVWELLTMLV